MKVFSLMKYYYPPNLIRFLYLNLRFNHKIDKNKYILINSKTDLSLSKSAQIIMKNNSLLTFNYIHNLYWHKHKASLMMKENSKLIIEQGECRIYTGNRIFIDKNKKITIGANTDIVCDCKLFAYEDIYIGNNCMIGWESQIMSGDGHKIFKDGIHSNKAKPIIIEDNVWIGSRVTILKGIKIGKNSIIASNSVVTKDIPSGCIAAGNPAKIVAQNVYWKK